MTYLYIAIGILGGLALVAGLSFFLGKKFQENTNLKKENEKRKKTNEILSDPPPSRNRILEWMRHG